MEKTNKLSKIFAVLSLISSVFPIIIYYKGLFDVKQTLFIHFLLAPMVWLLFTFFAIALAKGQKKFWWLLILFPLAFWAFLVGLWFAIGIRLVGFAP